MALYNYFDPLFSVCFLFVWFGWLVGFNDVIPAKIGRVCACERVCVRERERWKSATKVAGT